MRGTLCSFDMQKDRWAVKLQNSTEEPKLIKTSNLVTLSGAEADVLSSLVVAFCEEISAAPSARVGATGLAVLAALDAELVLPLRSLNEDRLAGTTMARTFGGDPLPAKKINACVDEITSHVLDGTYSSWRYENPVGSHQLAGLTAKQRALWAEPSRTEAEDGIVVHEDAPGELGLFWATKIGGPSHGFDFEGQCLLPLLANARHKVVLVSDPGWPHHPVGRAHFRLLWDADSKPPKPVLWLEAINADFGARGVNRGAWEGAVIQHVVSKAEAMGALLSLSTSAGRALAGFVEEERYCREDQRLILRPSNAVVEASDYLSSRHDWLQLDEETTSEMSRVVYEPSSMSSDLLVEEEGSACYKRNISEV